MAIRRRFALLVSSLLLVAACTSRQAAEPVFGSGPRFPDDEGLVTDINFDHVVMDGKRRYEIRQDVQSFSTYDGTVIPLLHHKGRYIHLGIDEKKRVEWMAGIGLVVEVPSPTVVYNGVVQKVQKDKRRVIFEDGTVLTLYKDVSLPARGQKISAKIHPFKRVVVEIVLQ